MKTLNIAHRGARSIAPENTILAALRGWQAGADLWETDVAVTKDEQLILMHDHSLERTTDVKQKFPRKKSYQVIDYSLEEIRTLDSGSRYIETDPFREIAEGTLSEKDLEAIKGEKIPTLEEALDFTRDKKWKINLELKQLPERLDYFPLPGRVSEIIEKSGIEKDRVIVSSFRHDWLHDFKKLGPHMQVQALIGDDNDPALEWGSYEFDTYNALYTLIDEAQIQKAKKKGKRINLFTVNNVADMAHFIKLGVDGMFTDYPRRLSWLLQGYKD